jgi:phosphoglycolate phosphatase
MAIKLAIFDFDGTLADTYPLFADSLNALAAKHGFRQITPGEMHTLRSLSASQVLGALQLPLWRVPAVLADFRRVMLERIHEVQPFAGVLEVLRTLAQRRVALALASSNSLDNVRAVLGPAVLDRFAALECGATLFGKPRRLRRILQKTGSDASATIYIGDEIRDAHAAARLGMTFGAVAWGYTDLEALLRLNPAKVFRTPADLLDLG